MADELTTLVEDWVQSAAELPTPSVGFRERVLRAARRAEKQRVYRRRAKWSVCGAAAAMVIAGFTGMMLMPTSTTESASQSTKPGANVHEQQSDFDLAEAKKRETTEKSGVVRGSF
jgi:hypothetical protein